MVDEPDPSRFPLELVLKLCVTGIALGEDYATYMRRAESLARPPSRLLGMSSEQGGFVMRMLAREVWRQCPHPAYRYAAAPLPTPGRNDPCDCGSGRKYKQCCAAREGPPPLPPLNFLDLLLEALPRKRWSDLAHSHVSLEMVIDAAHIRGQGARYAEVVSLLEPWLEGARAWPARYEPLFDLLTDAYEASNKPRKKRALIELALAQEDAALRSAAQQRMATIAADAGDFAAAWEWFGKAQRGTPDSAHLSHLEVVLLVSEGRGEEARERARFWLARLARRRDPELEGLMELLRDVVEGGGKAFGKAVVTRDPQLAHLARLWECAPAPTCRYALQPLDGSAGPLRPDASLDAALAIWRKLESVCGPFTLSPDINGGADGVSLWLDLLERRPILWDAFDVLDDIVQALHALDTMGIDDYLVSPLLQRAETLLRQALRANRAESLRLEWGWVQNRPALRLLGERIAAGMDTAPTPEHLARLEWLVGTLNPDDNQGFREVLMRCYLEMGRPVDAVALSARYPDDLADMRYDRALALYMAGRKGDALMALRDAVASYPRPLSWLLKAQPKPPRQGRYGVTVGGDEEAWLYRQRMRALWESSGALAWAAEVRSALGAGVKKR